MKKIILMAAVLTVSVVAGARNWRINYDENSGADFKTLKAACESADVKKGDVLYLEPGVHYGTVAENTISKAGLKIVGPGWGFKTNADEAIEIATTNFVNGITIKADSVHLVGVHMNGKTIWFEKSTSASNPHKSVTIERCKCSSIYASGREFSSLIIRNNFITYELYFSLSSDYGCRLHQSIIEGNIITGTVRLGYGSLGCRFDHNTIVGAGAQLISCGGGGVQVTNNIFIHTTNSAYIFYNYDMNIFKNNVLSITPEQYAADAASGYPSYSNYPSNQFVGATVANTFVNQVSGDYFDEAMRYIVLEGSVAKTADSNGGECGAFGAAQPYVLHGRPTGIPYLYDVDVPEQPTNNQLTITFKVAGQNE